MPEMAPFLAAELASGVYNLNSTDKLALRAFLKSKVFSQSSQSQMEGATGGRIFRAAKDGFGLCASGAGIHKNDIFLIFRGTTTANNKADFVTDTRIGIERSHAGLPVHIGFNHTFSSMLPDIRQFILDSKAQGTVHCIGHSLGGAIAGLAADWVSRNSALKVKLYTFGAPRVGTEWFSMSTTNSIGSHNMHRAYHRTDPVPMVALYPYMQAPYRTIGHYLYSAQPLSTGQAHRMINYIESVGTKSWSQLSDIPEQPYTVGTAIESWLKSKSPINSNDHAFWIWVESALIHVLKKITMKGIVALQGVLIGAFTLADKIAYILVKGLDLLEDVSIWVELLMRKLMQALGMKVAETKKALTRQLIRYVLIRITEKLSRYANNALKIL